MNHRPRRPRRRQRFAVLTASAALAGAGALLPSNAFAVSAAAPPQAGPTGVTATASGHAGHRDRGDDGYRIRYCHWHQRAHHQSWGRWDCHTYWYGHGNGDWKGGWNGHWKGDWKGDWSGYDSRGHRA
ncbi:hypothetical protein [Streptomyces sp. NBC_01244]|uniref:hypothetical protein n=1 Tax=Streptomyces sp. NBC_01244 TaxID=2903797 RepID=UPI002E0DB67E|nr:hypothetical protein OG247_27290 [Streptomyces sp. NBC_01244]